MIHGILLVHKKAGGTSHDIVSSLRRILGQKAVGHAGTLDPMATGLMVILLGQGTKLSSYLLTRNKKYEFSFKLGAETDTLDKTGKIVRQQLVNFKKSRIKEILNTHQGTLSLPVPLVSAVKIKGKKLYQYKRENKTVELPKREMSFYDLEIKKIEADEIKVKISCSKGSYIRSWVSFIGKELETGAYLESLTRLESEPFKLSSSLFVDEIENRVKNLKDPETLVQKLTPAFIPFSKALPHFHFICASRQDERQLRSGSLSRDLKINLNKEQVEVNKNSQTRTIRVMNQEQKQMLALLELRPFLSPQFLRVFPEGLS